MESYIQRLERLESIALGHAGVVKAFAMTTMQQHQEHLAAFNAGVTRLGGAAQTAPVLDCSTMAPTGLSSPPRTAAAKA